MKGLPTILAVIGSAGVVVTAALAAYGTFKAEKVLNDICENEEFEELPVKEKAVVIAKNSWKDYIPALVSAGVTITCIAASNKAHLKAEAALVAAAGVLSSQLKKINREVVEEFGKDKFKELQRNIVHKDAIRNKDKLKSLPAPAEEEEIFYEPILEEYITMKRSDLLYAETELNKMFHKTGKCSFRYFAEHLPRKNSYLGDWTDELGWRMNDSSFNIEDSKYGYYICVEPVYRDDIDGDHQAYELVYSVLPAEPSQEYLDEQRSFRGLVKRGVA